MIESQWSENRCSSLPVRWESGKTSVLGEASDILALQNIAHAALDLDAFGLAHLPSGASNDAVMYRNLQCCLQELRFPRNKAIPGGARDRRPCPHWNVVAGPFQLRTRSSVVSPRTLRTMRKRIKMRESGVLQQQFVARVAKLNSILDRARLEDFVVTSDDRSVTQIAHEMLLKAGWISK